MRQRVTLLKTSTFREEARKLIIKANREFKRSDTYRPFPSRHCLSFLTNSKKGWKLTRVVTLLECDHNNSCLLGTNDMKGLDGGIRIRSLKSI
jgi:hypothetical protein